MPCLLASPQSGLTLRVLFSCKLFPIHSLTGMLCIALHAPRRPPSLCSRMFCASSLQVLQSWHRGLHRPSPPGVGADNCVAIGSTSAFPSGGKNPEGQRPCSVLLTTYSPQHLRPWPTLLLPNYLPDAGERSRYQREVGLGFGPVPPGPT